MLFMVEYWEPDFISYGNQGQCGFLCSEYGRPWKVVSQCLLNPCGWYCRRQRKGKIIEIKMNLLFLHIFLLLKDKSLFIFLLHSYKWDRAYIIFNFLLTLWHSNKWYFAFELYKIDYFCALSPSLWILIQDNNSALTLRIISGVILTLLMKLPLSLRFSSVLLVVADALDSDFTLKFFVRGKDFTIVSLSIQQE